MDSGLAASRRPGMTTAKISLNNVGSAPPPSSLDRNQAKREPFMAKMIFVSLPVSDLKRATAFYQAIGAVKNTQFSDNTASCMVFSDTIHAMLMTHDKYRHFTSKKIVDAKTSSQLLLCVTAESRAEVDDVVDKAVAAGGAPDPSPKDEFDFMYGRSFEDPDGHMWGVTW